jgi:ClpP class serine protease
MSTLTTAKEHAKAAAPGPAAGGGQLMAVCSQFLTPAARSGQPRPGRQRTAAVAAGTPRASIGEASGVDGSLYTVLGAVGVISLGGPIMYGASCCWWDGETETDEVCRALRAAAADARASVVLIDCHCPGGTVAGASDLLEAMAALKATGKRVVAYAHECMASLAYWLCSQADEIVATPTAALGAIGIVETLTSYSFDGLQVVPISTSPEKHAPGAVWEEAQIAPMRDAAGKLADVMVADIRRGRPKLAGEALRGRLVYGQTAVNLGLADRLSTFAALLDELNTLAGQPGALADLPVKPGQDRPINSPTNPAAPPSPEDEPVEAATNAGLKAMPDQNVNANANANANTNPPANAPANTPAAHAPATVAELKAAFPDDAQYVLTALERGASLLQAKADYTDVLRAKLAAMPAAPVQTAANPATTAARAAAVQGATLDGQTPPSAALPKGTAEAFAKAVSAYQGEKKCLRSEALAACARQDPQGAKAYRVVSGGMI